MGEPPVEKQQAKASKPGVIMLKIVLLCVVTFGLMVWVYTSFFSKNDTGSESAVHQPAEIDVAGKTFVWEKEGAGGDFTITLNEDGSYQYYAGYLSSYIGQGNWKLEDGVLTMTEDGTGYDYVFRFAAKDGELDYMADGSDPFLYVTVEDGDRFLYDETKTAPFAELGQDITEEAEAAPEEGSGATEESDFAASLFDTSFVHTIDVRISEEDWSDLLAHPTDKTKYTADVVIDGETVEDVSIATKGHSSLQLVAAKENSRRYSFKITFGNGKDKPTWHGLRKLNLNNGFADATCMKDYLSYGLFQKMGVAAPRASYIWVTINGGDQGLYTAVENVDQSLLDRAFAGEGTLYQPEHESIDEDLLQVIMGGGSAHREGADGADFVYIDDLPEHYADIFDNLETDEDPEAQAHVIRALKALSEREDLDAYLDTEGIIRYFAVHNFLLNFDSYTGPMLHNWFLRENNGQLSIIPWDYNAIFGAFPADGVTSHENDIALVVNQGIDSPLSGSPATEAERPMWSWIVEDERYRDLYHDALRELISEHFASGEFEEEFDALYEMLLPYVEKDPTAFSSPEMFRTAYATMREFALLRGESIRRQLDGELAAVTEQQTASDRVDTSGLALADMSIPLY